MDICEATDMVSHDILLYKLERYGLEGWTVRWIKNWLDGHRQRVAVNSSVSRWRPVMSTGLQGSFLRMALLKILKISDLVRRIKGTLSKCSLQRTPSQVVWLT